MATSGRKSWISALLLLAMIWTLWFIRVKDTPTVPQVVPVVAGAAIPAAPAPATVPKLDSAPQPHNPDPSEGDTPSTPNIDALSALKADSDSHERTVISSSLATPMPSSNFTPPANPSRPKKTQKSGAGNGEAKDRPLVTYVYSQTPSAEANLRYFIKHALNDAADFIFIINGDVTISRQIIPKLDNIQVVERENDCYDLGSHAKILTTKISTKDASGQAMELERWKNYKRFILLNASIRGPFMPNWSNRCWMDAYLSKVTEEVKLVGMTANCWPQFHVQSMIWATDSVGLGLLLYPPQPAKIPEGLPENWKEVGINGCFHTWDEAVHAEVFSTQIIRDAGHKVAVMMSAFYSDEKYIDHCDSGGNGDVLWNGKYFGANVHPYETIFMKTNRDIDPVLIDKLTNWKSGEEYSSFNYC